MNLKIILINLKEILDNTNIFIDDYNSIYENDIINNYKSFYINQLNYIREFKVFQTNENI